MTVLLLSGRHLGFAGFPLRSQPFAEKVGGAVYVAHDEGEVAKAEDGLRHTQLPFLTLEKPSNHGNKNQAAPPSENHLKPIHES